MRRILFAIYGVLLNYKGSSSWNLVPLYRTSTSMGPSVWCCFPPHTCHCGERSTNFRFVVCPDLNHVGSIYVNIPNYRIGTPDT